MAACDLCCLLHGESRGDEGRDLIGIGSSTQLLRQGQRAADQIRGCIWPCTGRISLSCEWILVTHDMSPYDHPTRTTGPGLKIGFLGGSLDPVHFGHLLAAQDAYEQCQLDRLIFVPRRKLHSSHRRCSRALRTADNASPALECDKRSRYRC